MAERIIHTADLSRINNDLRNLSHGVDAISGQVNVIDSTLNRTRDELDQLIKSFSDFVAADTRAKELSLAETRQVKVRQEIDTKFGHYGQVRRIATGILQASDIQIVRQNTLQNATEELMLLTPQYWLAPALVALSAWLNDNAPLAERALAEAITRDDEKTSLFFALISKRADRADACATWLARYLGQQDPKLLDRQTVVLIDALVSGVFGMGLRANCLTTVESWVDELKAQAGFVDIQHRQWKDAITSKHSNIDYRDSYPYLSNVADTSDWQTINTALNHSNIHATLTDYFGKIFQGNITPAASLRAEVDILLDKLVQNFDDEELPLRQQERYCQAVIDAMGDKRHADKNYKLTQHALDDKVSFTQLLTNAAMHPESSHASLATQRYAIALSKEWIDYAHQDLTANIRQNFPRAIHFGLADPDITWRGSSTDGTNESELLQSLHSFIEQERQAKLAQVKLAAATYVKAVIGVAIIAYFFGIFGLVVGGALLAWAWWDYQGLGKRRSFVNAQYDALQESAAQELKAVLADIVEMRIQLTNQDRQAADTTALLDSIVAKEYVLSSHNNARGVL
ncbi:MAG: hypothetical protein Q4G13_07830 [Moraxella sp.]|nr:hypothetical protein [Moraxella sp.]